MDKLAKLSNNTIQKEMQALIESAGWKILCESLESRLNQVTDTLLDDTKINEEITRLKYCEINLIQTQAKTIKFIIGLPQGLVDENQMIDSVDYSNRL